MRVEQIEIGRLVPYAKNARTHSESQVEQIANSIKEFGFNNPVLIDPDDGIIAGHGRVLAAKKLDLVSVPCIRLGHLSDAQKRAFILADNKLTINAGWDEELLRAEIEALQADDFNLDLTGFSESEILNILDQDDGGNDYTNKVKSPVYETTGEKPEIFQLYDNEKVTRLLEKIEQSNVADEEKMFLKTAAQRHLVFSYREIAEYYAHSDAEMQELMEDSALVIVDFGKAIEDGFASLSSEIAEAYADERSDV